jgi:hypothetical protein
VTSQGSISQALSAAIDFFTHFSSTFALNGTQVQGPCFLSILFWMRGRFTRTGEI